MGQCNYWTLFMSIRDRLIALRHERNLTQQEMADMITVHVNQIRRYEAGTTQPSLEVLKKIAIAMSVTIDSLAFDTHERGPDDELKLQFEALQQFTPEEKIVAKAVLESLILKHDSSRFSRSA